MKDKIRIRHIRNTSIKTLPLAICGKAVTDEDYSNIDHYFAQTIAQCKKFKCFDKDQVPCMQCIKAILTVLR